MNTMGCSKILPGAYFNRLQTIILLITSQAKY